MIAVFGRAPRITEEQIIAENADTLITMNHHRVQNRTPDYTVRCSGVSVLTPTVSWLVVRQPELDRILQSIIREPSTKTFHALSGLYGICFALYFWPVSTVWVGGMDLYLSYRSDLSWTGHCCRNLHADILTRMKDLYGDRLLLAPRLQESIETIRGRRIAR